MSKTKLIIIGLMIIIFSTILGIIGTISGLNENVSIIRIIDLWIKICILYGIGGVILFYNIVK